MIKHIIKSSVARTLSEFDLSITRQPKPLARNSSSIIQITFDHALCLYLVHSSKKPFFVQVGSHDGVSNDPVYYYAKRGLITGCLIEPQADIFSKLEQNYRSVRDMQFINAAISDTDGYSLLFKVDPSAKGPEWISQLASFDQNVILKHEIECPGIAEFIVQEKIRTVSVPKLLGSLRQNPDILVIDTEGSDDKILTYFIDAQCRPEILLFEHKHLSKKRQHKCIEMLLSIGYQVTVMKFDTLAVMPKLLVERS